MTYELYTQDGQVIKQGDIQDKMSWCRRGETLEDEFLRVYGDRLKLKLNPAKKEKPTVPDFIYIPGNRIADLKTVNTPFFSARRYGVDPQYAVTFNKKDLEYYRRCYSDILLYFSIDWIATKLVIKGCKIYTVEPMVGVWGIRFCNIQKLCCPENLHEYKLRIGDKVNATHSYVLDLRRNEFGKVI